MKRRDLLHGISGAPLIGLAGCLGGNPSAKGETTTAGKTEDGGGSDGSDGTATKSGLGVGEKPPDFTLQTTAGTPVSLHPVEQPTVLFFMAAWCTSCKQEESNLKQIHQKYGDDVRLISIDMDPDRDTMDDLRQFKQQYGGDWIHAMGTTQLIQTYRLTSLDTTYIIKQSGLTAYTDSDVTSVETFEQELTKLL